MAVDAIRDHHLAVVGVCHFDPEDGATTRFQFEAPTKRALIAAAGELIVPIESHRLGILAPFQIAAATDIGLLVIGETIEPDLLQRCRPAGVEVTSL